MRRHMEEQHRYGPEQECSSTPQPRAPASTNAPPCIPLPQQQQTMIFQHPFTMSVSGPTSCGKTTFVKKLLLNNLIQPLPTRIIWLYRRWQPLYDDVKGAVYPPVEFIQGIPAKLGEDTFVSTLDNNVIVLDDLMSTASKDSRITELFTEGSHHRNLSVISINQNLYHSKDPTQRRNCHYLTLFNNPIDKQPVMTLARQMYPGDAHKFMNMFNQATLNPYGHLVVDLKPMTHESLRLRPNILEQSCVASTKGLGQLTSNQFSFDGQRYNIDQQVHTRDDMTTYRPIMDKLSCIDCGSLYASPMDLQKHVKRGCPEAYESDEERPRKISKYDSELESGEENTNNEGSDEEWDADELGFQQLVHKAFHQYDDIYVDKVDKLMEEEDITEEAARRDVNDILRSRYRKSLMREYKTFINMAHLMRSSSAHNEIKGAINAYFKDGYDFDDAVKLALKDKNYVFDLLLNQFDSDSSSERDTEDDNEDRDSE